MNLIRVSASRVEFLKGFLASIGFVDVILFGTWDIIFDVRVPGSIICLPHTNKAYMRGNFFANLDFMAKQ